MNIKAVYFLISMITLSLIINPIQAQKKQSAKAVATKVVGISTPSNIDSLSYAIGFLEYKNFKKNNLDIKISDFKLGLDASETNTSNLTEEVAGAIIQKILAQKAKEKGLANKQKNVDFFTLLKNKAGIKEIKPGLFYEVIKEGTGEKPASDTVKVKVNYIGTLIDGKEFDNSFTRGTPAVFPLNGVIKGWTEALKLMSVGATWKIYLDSEWGYGASGAGATIPPNAALIFQVDFIEIVK